VWQILNISVTADVWNVVLLGDHRSYVISGVNSISRIVGLTVIDSLAPLKSRLKTHLFNHPDLQYIAEPLGHCPIASEVTTRWCYINLIIIITIIITVSVLREQRTTVLRSVTPCVTCYTIELLSQLVPDINWINALPVSNNLQVD